MDIGTLWHIRILFFMISIVWLLGLSALWIQRPSRKPTERKTSNLIMVFISTTLLFRECHPLGLGRKGLNYLEIGLIAPVHQQVSEDRTWGFSTMVWTFLLFQILYICFILFFDHFVHLIQVSLLWWERNSFLRRGRNCSALWNPTDSFDFLLWEICSILTGPGVPLYWLCLFASPNRLA